LEVSLKETVLTQIKLRILQVLMIISSKKSRYMD
jgi:hypothetical protein